MRRLWYIRQVRRENTATPAKIRGLLPVLGLKKETVSMHKRFYKHQSWLGVAEVGRELLQGELDSGR